MSIVIERTDTDPAVRKAFGDRHWSTGTDRAEFNCVWKGQHFRLMSLSEHLKQKIPDDRFLLMDKDYRTHLAPKQDVHIGHRI